MRGLAGFGRVLCGVLGIVLAVLSLEYVNSLMQEPRSPAQRLVDSAGEPWLERPSLLKDDLRQLARETGDKTIGVATVLTISAPEGPRDYGRVRLTTAFSGPVDNPLMRAVREGRARGRALELAFLLGAYPNLSASLAYGEPTTVVNGNEQTVSMDAVADFLASESTAVDVVEPGDLCGKLARRTITVVGVGMTVSSASTRPATNCGDDGGWRDQSAGQAVFAGMGRARIELIQGTGAAPDRSSPREPLFVVGRDLTTLLTVVGFDLLAAIPLLIAWFRLRTPRFTTRGEVFNGRTSKAMGTLLLLHALISGGAVLSIALNSVDTELFSALGLSTSVAAIPIALMVALGLVWRRLALRTVLDLPQRRRDGWWILLAAVALLGIAAVSSAKEPGSWWSQDGPDWFLTRPGFLLVVVAVLHLAALVGVVLVWRRRPRRLVWTIPLVTAVGLLLLLEQGMLWRPPDDGTAPRTWVDWLMTGDGVAAVGVSVLLAVAALGIGFVWNVMVKQGIGDWPTSLRVMLVVVAVVAGGVVFVVGLLMPILYLPVLFKPYHWHWLSDRLSWTDWYQSPAGQLFALYGAGLLAVFGVFLLGRALKVSARTHVTMVAGTVLTAALLLVEPLTTQSGLVADVVGAVVPLTASVLVWLTLDRVVRHVVNTDPPARWQRLRPRLRNWRGLRVVSALVLSVPLVVYGGDFGPRIHWTDFTTFASSIDGALPLIALVLLVLLVRHLGTPGADGQTRGSFHLLRTTTLLVAIVGLLSPSATVVGVPVAFLVGWLLLATWLLPRPKDGTAHPVVGQAAEQETEEAVRAVILGTVKERAEATLEKGLRQNLADGTPEVQEQRLNRITELTMSKRGNASRVLSSYGGLAPWRRALEFAVIGFVVGLPWTVLDIGAVLGTLTDGGPFRLVDAASGGLVILRFAIAGLVLGAAYPLVRGATGLSKGLSLFVALAGPALCVTLLPDPRAHDALAGAVLQLGQWLSFGLVLGLTADWLTLKRHGYGLRHLRELHRMNALTASASTLLVAVLTATVTAIGTGAAGVFVDRVLTPPPVAASSAATK